MKEDHKPQVIERLIQAQIACEAMAVSIEQYEAAIEELFKLALMSCGSARCAAEVLLNFYDGSRWKVDLVDICCRLDGHYFEMFITAVKGRALLMREPQAVIANGEQRFRNLAEEWT